MNRDELERRVTHDLIFHNLIRCPIEFMLKHNPGARLLNMAALHLLRTAETGVCLSHMVARNCAATLLNHPMLSDSIRRDLTFLVDSKSKPRNPILLFPAVNTHNGVLFRIELRNATASSEDDKEKKLDINDSGYFARKNGEFIRDMLEIFGPGLFDGIDAASALQSLEIKAFTKQILKTSLDMTSPPVIAWNGLDSADLSAAIAVLTHFLGGVNCRILATGRVEGGRVRRIEGLKCKLDLTLAEAPDLDVVFIPKENEAEAEGFDLPIRAVDSIDQVFSYLLDNACSSPDKRPIKEIARSYEALYKSIPDVDPRAACLKSRMMSLLYSSKLDRIPDHERSAWANALIHRAFIHHSNFELDYVEKQYRRLTEAVKDTKSYTHYKDQIRARRAAVLTALYRFDEALELIRQPDNLEDDEDSVPSAIHGECFLLAGYLDIAEHQFNRVEARYKESSDSPRLAAYWMRLDMTRGDLDAALDCMLHADRILTQYPNDGQTMYIRQCEVKLRYLRGEWNEAFDLAQQLDQQYRSTLHHHWPGVLWRRFGGLSALKLGRIEKARQMMMPDPSNLPSAPILKIHACAPLIDYRLDEFNRTGKLHPSFDEELEPLRWQPVAHHFAGLLRSLDLEIPSDSPDPRIVGILSELARKIYE